MIGDTEPEDRYDAGDPLPDRLIVLAAILAAAADDDWVRQMRRIVLVRRLLGSIADG